MSTNYLDMLNSTGWIDSKIKNSFTNTTNMLTKMYSKSMPDISDIGKPQKELNEKIEEDHIRSTTNSYLTGIEIIDTEAGQWSGYPSTKKIVYSKGSSLRRPLSIPDFNQLTDIEGIRESNFEHEKPIEQPQNMEEFQLQNSHRLNHNHHGMIRDDKLSTFLRERHDILQDMANQRRGSKGFSAADEYKRLLTEEKLNKDYNHVNTIYQPSYLKNKPSLSTRTSLDSFRFNECAVETVQSADVYQSSQKENGSDRAMSEPIQTASSSRYAPLFKPTAQATYEAHAMRDPTLLNRMYYAGNATSPVKNNDSTPIRYLPEYIRASQTDEQNNDIGGSANAEVEVITHEEENTQNNEVPYDEKQQIYGVPKQEQYFKKGGYNDIARKNKELKNKSNTKRVRRRVEAKSLYNVEKENSISPKAKNSKSKEEECQCSDEETTETDVKQSSDAPPYYSNVDYEAYNQHMQQLMDNHQPSNRLSRSPENKPSDGVYDDSPLAKQYFSTNSNNNTSLPIYHDLPRASEYFAQKQNPLPPLKGSPPRGNSPPQSYQPVDPLAFKLQKSDVEQNNARRNKIQRQKEYAEILRHNQKEIAREKPQVRSWNKGQSDENAYLESKRAAALEYANSIQRPVLKEYNFATLPSNEENLPDVIEIMRQRHEEEKRKIEEMRAEIQHKIEQERSGKGH